MKKELLLILLSCSLAAVMTFFIQPKRVEAICDGASVSCVPYTCDSGGCECRPGPISYHGCNGSSEASCNAINFSCSAAECYNDGACEWENSCTYANWVDQGCGDGRCPGKHLETKQSTNGCEALWQCGADCGGGPPPTDPPPCNRPSLCGSSVPVGAGATINLTPGMGSTTITMNANTAVTGFAYAFYNEDDMADPTDERTKRIIMHNVGGVPTNYIVTHSYGTARVTDTLTVSYADLNQADVNPDWNGSVPTHISITGYFFGKPGDCYAGYSFPDGNCISHIDLTSCSGMSVSGAPNPVIAGNSVTASATVPTSTQGTFNGIAMSMNGAGCAQNGGLDTTSPYQLSCTPSVAGTLNLSAEAQVNGVANVCTATNTVTVNPAYACSSLDVSGAASMNVGNSSTYTATVTEANGTHDQIKATLSTVSDGGTAVFSNNLTTITLGNGVNDVAVTGTHTGTVRLTMVAWKGGVSYAATCTDTLDITINPNTVAVTAHGHAVDTTCGHQTDLTVLNGTTATLDDTAGDPPDAPISYSSNFNSYQVVFPSVNGPVNNGSITYYLRFPTPANYEYRACGAGPQIRPIVLNGYDPVDVGPVDFNFTEMADPWYQLVGGDGGAAGGTITANIPADMSWMLPAGTNSPGALISSTVGGVSWTDDGELGDGAWQVEGSHYTTPPNDDYGLMFRLFEMANASSTVPSSITQFADFSGLASQVTYPDFSISLLSGGPLTVNGSITVSDTTKRTIFVPGNLTVNSNIVVPAGDFLAFVVNGTITFGSGVTQAEGVYFAQNLITIDDATSGVGSARQFKGGGIFVGWGGVSFSRNLNSAGDASDDLANNTAAAEVFTYRPDFIINAPDGFKRSGIEWQEIAPGAAPVTPVEPPMEASCTGTHYCMIGVPCCVDGAWACPNVCTPEF